MNCLSRMGGLLLAASCLIACSGGAGTSGTATTNNTSVTDTATDGTQDDDKVASFARTCEEGLELAKRALPLLLSVEGPRTQENLLVPYNQMSIDIERSMATAGLMDAVHPDEEIRNAAKECESKTSEFISELNLNRKLYEAFASVDVGKLDTHARRLVEKTLRGYRRAGVDRDEATRARLKEIEKELVEAGQAFSQNIVDDVRSIEIPSAEGLKGLPEDYIAAHTEGSGPITVNTTYPDYIPFMQYAENDELRKQLYIASKSRADGKNEEVLRTILKLRDEKARILGYESWADYITEDKMMKSAARADEFIERVVKTAQSRAQEDYKELLTWKRKNVDKKAKSVEDWEKIYIEGKVKQAKYDFDPQSVRPYFPYKQVEAGLLDITSKVYDIQYEPVDVEVWHEDVRVFDVMQNGAKIGRIYLDMHPRDGKYGHAAQFTFRSGVKGVQVPEGVLVCNFPNPRTSNGPALMEHGDVTTMFHEFGHLMHHVLGGQREWLDQSGVATEWDFVEAPSQMFEEWAWSHNTLKGFAKHHETGEEIPSELVDKMRRADKFGVGLATVQQMFYAAVSLEFHKANPSELDMTATVKTLQNKYTPFAFVEGTKFHANFGHLNGYSALYYTYMWSLVIAKDLLTPFKKHGLMNTEWTYRYRDTVLAAGGTKDAAELVADFLGRDYNFKAFEEYLKK